MAKGKRKNLHVGGEQLPFEIMLPETTWQVPAELPDLTGRGKVEVAWDTETKDEGLAAKRGAGWARRAGYVCGVAASWDGGRQSLYVPIRHPDTANFSREQVGRWLTHHWSSPDVTCVFHNAPYDIGWCRADLDAPLPAGPIEDTGGMAYMVDENRLRYGLDPLCKEYGLPGKDETVLRLAASAYARDAKVDLWRFPAKYVGAYGEGDPRSTLQLLAALRPLVAEQEVDGAYRLEMDIVPLCVEMQRRGVRVNLEAAELAAQQLEAQVQVLLTDLGERLGMPGRVGMEEMRSNRVLAAWHTAERVSFPMTKGTAKSPPVPSFNKVWMRRHEHWLPRTVDKVRSLHDAANKFIRGFLIDYSHRGRLHSSVNQFKTEDDTEEGAQHGTVSYRFSYSDPPLQQMPARDEEISAVIRGAFEPEPGELWLAADYSQQEYRLIVHYAAAFDLPGAARAVQRYVEDPSTDFHAYVAEITGLERKPAKDSNFAKAYGAQVPKFASMIGKSLEEAQAIYDQYDRELPFVSKLAQRMEELARQRGYVRLIDGARCRFDFWESYGSRDPETREKIYLRPTTKQAALLWVDNMAATRGVRPRIRRADVRKGLNRLIQGGSARQMKMAMRECWRAGIVPLLQMHDELDLSVADPSVGLRVGEIMRSIERERLRVPMLVDLEYGHTWGHARKVKSTGYRATWDEAVAQRAQLAA